MVVGGGCNFRQIGNLNQTCQTGRPCVCSGIGNCDVSCPGGNCNVECQGTGNCLVHCPAGGCGVTCQGTGNCVIEECSGGCGLLCSGTGNCICSEGCGTSPDGGLDGGLPSDGGLDASATTPDAAAAD